MIENNTLARPYAKAAFAYAQDSKDTVKWSAKLMELGDIVKIPEMANLMGNPKLNCAQILEIIGCITTDLNEYMKNFVHTLAVNHRLKLLPAIAELFNEYKAEAERTINVHITSAFPLEDAQRDQFAQVLSKRLQRTVNIDSQTDDKLIGGAIIRAGDQVIDGSVRGRLTQLADSLING